MAGILTFLRPLDYPSIRTILILQDGSAKHTLEIANALRTLFPESYFEGAVCEESYPMFNDSVFDELTLMRWEDRFEQIKHLRSKRYDVVAALHRKHGRCALRRLPYLLRTRHILIFNENLDYFPVKLWRFQAVAEHYNGRKDIAGLLFKAGFKFMATPLVAIYLVGSVMGIYLRSIPRRLRSNG